MAHPRAAGAVAPAATVTDAAGRAVPVPEHVARVFPAGPPAAILLYTLAPELLLGWPRANRPEEREFLLPDIGNRPEIGRLTGRGNTANLEVVLALKTDVIFDVGSTDATYVSLAERVQQQTGIPYALLDGRFDKIPATYRTLGALVGQREQGRSPRAPCRGHDDDDHPPRRGCPRRAAAARLLCARAARARDRARRLDQRRDHRVARRSNVAAERRGGLAIVSIEQVLLWNPDVIVTIDHNFAANVRSDPPGLRSRRCAPAAFTCRRNCRSAGSISRRRSTG